MTTEDENDYVEEEENVDRSESKPRVIPPPQPVISHSQIIPTVIPTPDNEDLSSSEPISTTPINSFASPPTQAVPIPVAKPINPLLSFEDESHQGFTESPDPLTGKSPIHERNANAVKTSSISSIPQEFEKNIIEPIIAPIVKTIESLPEKIEDLNRKPTKLYKYNIVATLPFKITGSTEERAIESFRQMFNEAPQELIDKFKFTVERSDVLRFFGESTRFVKVTCPECKFRYYAKSLDEAERVAENHVTEKGCSPENVRLRDL
jgi:ssDNA-binding Zn-finger/Zn-ribbon topoisomerase 1